MGKRLSGRPSASMRFARLRYWGTKKEKEVSWSTERGRKYEGYLDRSSSEMKDLVLASLSTVSKDTKDSSEMIRSLSFEPELTSRRDEEAGRATEPPSSQRERSPSQSRR